MPKGGRLVVDIRLVPGRECRARDDYDIHSYSTFIYMIPLHARDSCEVSPSKCHFHQLSDEKPGSRNNKPRSRGMSESEPG